MAGQTSSYTKPDGFSWLLILKIHKYLNTHGAFFAGSITTILALCIYLFTMAPDITWSHFSSDGGELITAAVTLGIPHPPGYPTYVLLGKLASLLPIGSVAFRFNLFSAVAASVSAGFVAGIAFENLKGIHSARIAATATGLTVAFAPLVWSQATVTEVYALNLALLSIFLWALLGQRSSLLTGALLGISITSHLTSILLLPMAFVLTRRGHRIQLFGGIVLGLLPILALPILANQASPVIWGDPKSLDGWIWLISGQLYSGNFTVPGFAEFLNRLSLWSTAVWHQFAFIGWLFVLIGISTYRQGSRKLAWMLISALLYALFSLAYGTSDYLLFLAPSLLLLSPILAAGLSRMGHWSLLLPLILLLLNFSHYNLREDKIIRPMVEEIFSQLPPEAIILTPGDQSIFTLWYFTHVEGKRSDLFLVDSNLLAFEWYRERLKIQYPELKGLDGDNVSLFQALNSNNRQLCTLSLQSPKSVICHHNREYRLLDIN